MRMRRIRNGLWLFDILKIYFHANDGAHVTKNGMNWVYFVSFSVMENITKTRTVRRSHSLCARSRGIFRREQI